MTVALPLGISVKNLCEIRTADTGILQYNIATKAKKQYKFASNVLCLLDFCWEKCIIIHIIVQMDFEHGGLL